MNQQPPLYALRNEQYMNMASALCILLLAAGAAHGEEVTGDSTNESDLSYGPKGIQYESADGNNFLWFGVRLQTRYSTSAIRQDELPGDPVENESEFKVNRGRLKLGGHLVSPRFTVYSEYDFTSDTLLDLRMT